MAYPGSEWVLISFAFSLDPLYHIIIFQVIWVIGVSMIILGAIDLAAYARNCGYWQAYYFLDTIF